MITIISWLKERYVCTDQLWLCTKRQFSGDQECELETLSRMTNRPTVDDNFSSFSDFFFSIVQNRIKKRILEKRPNHKKIRWALTVDTRHIKLRGEPKVKHLKWLTRTFAGCQLRGIGLAVGKELQEFYFGVCRLGFHWFRADSAVYDWQKSWNNCFFRDLFLWDHLAAMSFSLFRG